MKPIWMHVMFGSAIAAGAIYVVRSERKEAQKHIDQTVPVAVARGITEAGDQLADRLEQRFNKVLNGLVSEDNEFSIPGAGPGHDPAQLVEG
jgi:hypothetical protein